MHYEGDSYTTLSKIKQGLSGEAAVIQTLSSYISDNLSKIIWWYRKKMKFIHLFAEAEIFKSHVNNRAEPEFTLYGKVWEFRDSRIVLTFVPPLVNWNFKPRISLAIRDTLTRNFIIDYIITRSFSIFYRQTYPIIIKL